MHMTTKDDLMTSPALPSTHIEDVYTVPIKTFADERGRFMETFRREWFPWINWDRMQSNRSESKRHVLRGLHYHLHQIDYWYVVNGVIRVGMVDLRPSSPTHMAVETLEIGEANNIGVFIPVGVAHGFVALTDGVDVDGDEFAFGLAGQQLGDKRLLHCAGRVNLSATFRQ